MRRWRERNPEKVRANQMKYLYGITLAEYEELFASQGAACAACGSSSTGGRGWHIDHCHVMGKVWGILCLSCNTALGMVGDSSDRLLDLLNYLKPRERVNG